MKQIKAHLKAHGLTLEWLSERVGVSRNTLKKWVVVPPRHVVAVEAATGISRYDQRPDIFGPPPSQAATPPAGRDAAPLGAFYQKGK
jgi:DNA-binding transcriptional regulator YdaS (Cro superfamily)